MKITAPNNPLKGLAEQLGLPTSGQTSAQLSSAISGLIAPPTLINIANKVSAATLNSIMGTGFTLDRTTTVNRVQFDVTTKQAGVLMEVVLYNASNAKVSSSGVRECPEPGRLEWAIDEVTLPAGSYSFTVNIYGTDKTIQVGINPYVGGFTVVPPSALPAPATLGTTTATANAPSGAVMRKNPPKLTAPFVAQDTTAYVMGQNTATGDAYAMRGSGAGPYFLSVTADGGATYTDLCPWPYAVMSGKGSAQDLLVAEGSIYLLTDKGYLFRSSSLNAGMTFTDVSCPLVSQGGVRHDNAAGRPYGLGYLPGYVFQGEYTNAPNEVAPDGPRVLRYKIADGTWVRSFEVPNARHVHSFMTIPGNGAMHFTVGDDGYGNGVGVWRITPTGIGAGTAPNADAAVKWTGYAGAQGFATHYPVDIIYGGSKNAYPGALIGASDRNGFHLMHVKTAGSAGFFNINPLTFKPLVNTAWESVRSVVEDPATGNLYYWTAETADFALYAVTPQDKYTQPVRLRTYTATPSLVRSVVSKGYVLRGLERFPLVKFVGQ